MKNIFLLLALVGPLPACSSLDIDFPAPEVHSPITPGSKKITLGGGAKNTFRFESTGSADARPPDLSTPEIDYSFLMAPNFEYGWSDHISTSVDAESSGHFVGTLKYQILGSSWGQRAVGWQALAWARVGFGDSEDDYKEHDDDPNLPWEGTVDDSFYGGGFSIGRMMNDFTLLYLGAAYDEHSLKARLTQAEALDSSDPGGTYSREYDLYASSIGIGMHVLWESFSIDLSVSEAYANVDDDYDKEAGTIYGVKMLWLLD